jgi:hypothetical protein
MRDIALDVDAALFVVIVQISVLAVRLFHAMIHLVNDVIERNVAFHSMPMHTILVIAAEVTRYCEMAAKRRGGWSGMVGQVVTVIAFAPGLRKEDDTSRPEIINAFSLFRILFDRCIHSCLSCFVFPLLSLIILSVA